MALFDIFTPQQRNASPTQNQAPIVHHGQGSQQGPNMQQQPNPNDKVQQNNPDADPNKLPLNGEAKPNADDPISQLDSFKDLWKPATTADGKPIVDNDPFAQPLFTSDPAKFAEATRKMNFAAGIEPAQMQKALGGDVQAMMDILNSTSQNAFLAATQLSSNLVENGAKTNNSRFNSVLDKRFKEFLVREERTQDPILSHEAVAPMLDLAKRQIIAKNPSMSAGDVQAKAEEMLRTFAGAFTKNGENSRQQANGGDVDPFDFSGWDR